MEKKQWLLFMGIHEGKVFFQVVSRYGVHIMHLFEGVIEDRAPSRIMEVLMQIAPVEKDMENEGYYIDPASAFPYTRDGFKANEGVEELIECDKLEDIHPILVKTVLSFFPLIM